MIIDNKFNLGEIVFLKTDTDQKERIVLQISVRETGYLYELGCGGTSSWHYAFEISQEKNVLKATEN